MLTAAARPSPDRTFHNFRASKTGDGKLNVVPKRRFTDLKALKL